MINKPPRFKGLDIRIPTVIPVNGRGFIDQGSGLLHKKNLFLLGERKRYSNELPEPWMFF